MLSAREPAALRALADRYHARLARADGDAALAELCAAAALRRTHHEHRLACVGGSADELR